MLRQLGLWSLSSGDGRPKPADLTESLWDSSELTWVADYLDRGMLVRQHVGGELCRICGVVVEADELSDGSFLWPEALAHYVRVHRVRLPDEFLVHMFQTRCRLEGTPVDEEWWATSAAAGPLPSDRVGPSTLVRIGRWFDADTAADRRPRPQDLVDLSVSRSELDWVADYLDRGILTRVFVGEESCRMCGVVCGGRELSDGSFLWPEALAHYVRVHRVRLPEAFVEHVLQVACDLEDETLDDSWWIDAAHSVRSRRLLLRGPEQPPADGRTLPEVSARPLLPLGRLTSRALDDAEEVSLLQASAGTLDPYLRRRVADYLDGCPWLVAWIGGALAAVGERFVSGGGTLSNGSYYWDSNAAHYVREYGVAVPEAAIQHMQERQWSPPQLSAEEISELHQVLDAALDAG